MASKVDNSYGKRNPNRITSLGDIGHYGTERMKQNISLLIIGKTGEGKSETGNTILGETLFRTSDEAQSCTAKVEKYTRYNNNCGVTVVDTPGCADTNVADAILTEIATAITFVPDGYNAFLIVVKYPLKWTHEAAKVIDQLAKLFGEEFYRYCIVIFAYGDCFTSKQEIENSTKTFEDYVQNQNQTMGNLLQKVGYRALLFDNIKARRNENYRQDLVHKVFEEVHRIKRNEKGLYDNKLFEKARELQDKHSNSDTVLQSLIAYMKSLLSWCSIM